MHIFLILISSSSMALFLVLSSQIMKQKGKFTYSSNFVLSITHLSAAFFLMIPWSYFYLKGTISFPNSEFFFFASISTTLTLIAKLLYFYAYSKIDVAYVTIFSSLVPVFSVLSGWFFLKEELDLYEMIGLIIVTFSVYCLFLVPSTNTFTVKSFFQPFQTILSSKPTLFAFLSVIPPAISTVFVKKSVLNMDALSFSLYFMLSLGILSALIEIFSSSEISFKEQFLQLPKQFLLFSGLLMTVSQFAYSLATQYTQIANIAVLSRISSVFQIVLAYFILKEKNHLKKRIILSIIIILGFLINSLGKYF
jgi:drug/metabolite transporter (DMT)-like permease